MRHSVALMLLPFLTAAPLAAQFEGTIVMKMSSGNTSMTMTTRMKGDMEEMTMALPARSGQPAGESRTIIDSKAQTSTMLTPMPAGMSGMPGMAGAKGIKFVMDLSKPPTAGGTPNTKFDLKKLGTSERIAGFDCDDYEATGTNGKPLRMCLTSGLGGFTFPGSAGGGMGRGGPSTPTWAAAMKSGEFPLKVWEPGGAVLLETISIDKGSVPNSAFVIPDGYMDIGAMMGRGRGN